MNYIVFDIETYHPDRLDTFDVKAFRVSVTGAYISWDGEEGEYVAFLENDTTEIIKYMSMADMVVGYNHIWFDHAVLRKYSDFDLSTGLSNYDIMLELEKKLGFKPKLDDVCKATFASDTKTDHYETYKNYYWDSKWYELIDYCMNDVRLTNELYKKILKGEPLKVATLTGVQECVLDMPRIKSINKPAIAMDTIL
jgi:hypothetical protein